MRRVQGRLPCGLRRPTVLETTERAKSGGTRVPTGDSQAVRPIKVPKRRGYCDLKAQRSSRGRRLPLARTRAVSCLAVSGKAQTLGSPSGLHDAVRARSREHGRQTLDAAAARPLPRGSPALAPAREQHIGRAQVSAATIQTTRR